MSFAERLREGAGRRGHALPAAQHPEPFAGLDYAAELALKRDAFAAFWQDQRLPGRPDPVVAAPLPRGYRTTSKRRAEMGRSGLVLSFPGAPPLRHGLAPSALDLPEHSAVLGFLADQLARPPARALAATLNWLVVRGAAGTVAVILNVRELDARVVRGAKLVGQALQGATELGVRAAFLFLDPSASDYYLEARRPVGALSFKKLFGPDWLQVAVAGVRLRFPVTSFSQVNEAMLDVMVGTAGTLLGPLGGCDLLDLYCGYGLFSFTAGRDAAHVLGVEINEDAVAAARASAAFLRESGRRRFLAGRIDAPFLQQLPPHHGREVVLLDPPRQGTAPGVVEAVAARSPLRVVHICCGTDEIPREVAAWSREGYTVRRAVPLDLFAGTAALETLLLLGR